MRQSNVELLRILSMMFVVMVHLDGASLSLPVPAGDLEAITTRDLWQLSVQSITIVGVNCFTLISGYFGIRASIRGFFKYTFICIFYAVGIATYSGLCDVYHGFSFPWSQWGVSWMVFTHTDLWYVPAYLGLYILSPILNAAASTLSNRRFAAALAALTLFTVWCGWWWNMRFNPTGYTVMQLILMYLIGMGVRRFKLTPLGSERHWMLSIGISFYILATAATLGLSLYLDPLKAFAYNSPAVIIASTGLLIVFISFDCRSRFINRMAASAFSVYLLHKNPVIWNSYVKSLANRVWDTSDCLLYTLFVIAFTLGIYAACMLIDTVRIQLEKALFRIPWLR